MYSKYNDLDKALERTWDKNKEPDASGIIVDQQISESKEITDYINLSSVFTKLIQETGRFTEAFASDLLISINSFIQDATNLLKKKSSDKKYCVHYIGIRKNGVDGGEFIQINLQDAPETRNCYKLDNYYARLYAIVLTICPPSKANYGYYHLNAWLVDMTNNIICSDFNKEV